MHPARWPALGRSSDHARGMPMEGRKTEDGFHRREECCGGGSRRGAQGRVGCQRSPENRTGHLAISSASEVPWF